MSNDTPPSNNPSDHSPDLFGDLREEQRELNSFARATFSTFTDWWKFFVTANVALLAAFKAVEELQAVYFYVAPAVVIIDWSGIGFCFITCCRFVQISEATCHHWRI